MISNVICNSAKQGLIPQREYFDKDIANSDNTNGYYIIESNDFVYNPRKSADAPYGPISSYQYPEAGIVSPLYLCFRAKREINPLYFEWYFRSSTWHRYIYMSGDSGARHDRVSIKDDVFFAMPINVPSAKEQERITLFLDAIERRIETQRTLVETLKKYKRGLHKLVFIKKRKPSWEKLALHDIASFCGGGTPSKDVSSYWEGEIGWISSSDIQEEWIDDISVTRRITKTAIDNSATKLCPEGTIAIVSRVGVGKVAIMPESLCTSQDFTNITSITGNTHYMAYQIAFRMKLEAMKTQGTSIKGVTGDTIKAMVLDIPPLEEQKKIADMLTAFDSYIKRAVCELDLFLAMKKALLQQLFI
ncbi:restriction endonuclease subunit S [Colidextribacter sp. 210702-DFI.3.9]|nr:restriction endonuclease subunit S [Colidextribacter sp. 210702-DFI.3.9]